MLRLASVGADALIVPRGGIGVFVLRPGECVKTDIVPPGEASPAPTVGRGVPLIAVILRSSATKNPVVYRGILR